MNLTTKNGLNDPFSLARHFFAWDTPGKRDPDYPAYFNVKEDETELVLTADVPGFAKDNIEISLDDGVLKVSGSRAAEETKEGESFHIYERRYGSFTRSFRLPPQVDANEVRADLKDGILRIALAKKPDALPKKIEVK